MPTFTVPDSNSEDARPAPLSEFNKCHDPKSGRFADKGQGVCGPEIKVGITSARPKGDPNYRTNAEVFRGMREFARKLKGIPTVAGVKVEPGQGGFGGESESTWVVSFHGNGEARRLLAETGRDYGQDSVLLMTGTGGKSGSPMVEYTFEGPVRVGVREGIQAMMIAADLGWTWFKSKGKTVLRTTCVPQWGGDPLAHMTAVRRLSRELTIRKLNYRSRATLVKTEVMNREGENTYEEVLGLRRGGVSESAGPARQGPRRRHIRYLLAGQFARSAGLPGAA